MEMIWKLWENLHWTELMAVIFGLAYVVLAAKNSVWCWFWGILSCTLWAWAAFYLYQLYFDAILQVFYVGVSFLGIWQWQSGGEKKEELPITRLSHSVHVYLVASGLAASLFFGYFFEKYTQAAATYLDAFTTIFSILTTFLVVKKILENWLYWIVIDAVYIYLYWCRGSLLFTLLFVVYLAIAVAGYNSWLKMEKKRG